MIERVMQGVKHTSVVLSDGNATKHPMIRQPRGDSLCCNTARGFRIQIQRVRTRTYHGGCSSVGDRRSVGYREGWTWDNQFSSPVREGRRSLTANEERRDRKGAGENERRGHSGKTQAVKRVFRGRTKSARRGECEGQYTRWRRAAPR